MEKFVSITLDVRDFPPYNLTHMYRIGVPLSPGTL